MIGVDIVKIERIAAVAGSDRLFSNKEIEYAEKFKNKLEHYAGFYACKEALYKAISADKQREIKFNQISVEHDADGRPKLSFSGQTKSVLEGEQFEVTISHDGEYAVAFIIKKI